MRRIVVAIVSVSFILTGAPIAAVFASADHLRPIANGKTTGQLEVAGALLELNDGGIAMAQEALTTVISGRDGDYMDAVGSTGTAAFIAAPAVGTFTPGRTAYNMLRERQRAWIATNILSFAQIPGHSLAAYAQRAGMIVEVARSQMGYALSIAKVVNYLNEALTSLGLQIPMVLHVDHNQYAEDLFKQKDILKKEYEAVHGAGSFKADMPIDEIDEAVLANYRKTMQQNIVNERAAVTKVNEDAIKIGFTSIAIDASTLFDEIAGDYVMDYYATKGNTIERKIVEMERKFELPLEWGAAFLKANPDTDQELFAKVKNKIVSEMEKRNRSQAEINAEVAEMEAAFGALQKAALASGLNPKAMVINYDRIMTEIAEATIAGKLPKAVRNNLSQKQLDLLLPSSNVQETIIQLKSINELVAKYNPELGDKIGLEIEVGHVDKKVPNPRRGNKPEAKLTHPAAVKVMGVEVTGQGLRFDLIATNNGSGHGTDFDEVTLTPVSQVGKIRLFLTVELNAEAGKFGASLAQHGTSGSDMAELADLAQAGIIKFNIATNYQQIILNVISLIDDGLVGEALLEKVVEDSQALAEGLAAPTRAKIQKVARGIKDGSIPAAVSDEDSLFMRFMKVTYAWGLKKGKIKADSSADKIGTVLAKEFKRAFKDMDKPLYAMSHLDLSDYAGIPVSLDQVTGQLILGEGVVSEQRWSRPLKDAGNSIAHPAVIANDPNREVYYGFRNVGLADDWKNIEGKNLRFDITVLQPGLVDERGDREFIMTKGHQHPQSGDKGYPEIYEVWNGKAMYVQQGINKKTGEFEILATFANPGDKVVLLPGYSHRTVNIGSEPLVMANWISLEVGGSDTTPASAVVKPNFSEIEAKNGYAHWVMQDKDGRIELVQNPKYGAKPAAIRFATAAPAIESVSLSKDVPMYEIIKNPELAGKLSTFLTTARGFENVFDEAFKIIDRREAQFTHNAFSGELLPVERVGILTSGGTAAGHNNVIYNAFLEAAGRGIELVAIWEGWKGLVSDKLVAQARPLTLEEVEKAHKKGGTILRTSRENPFSDENRAKGTPGELWENINKLKLDGLITLGGDDTNTVSYKLQKEHPGFLIVGGSKTMDNDIALPNPNAPNYGHDTFVRAAIKQVKNMLVDYHATKRIGVVEVFGRKAGYVAARVGAAVNAARSLIPEEVIDLEQLIKDVKAYKEKHGFGVVIVSEGVTIDPKVGKNAEILEAALAKDDRATAAYAGKHVKKDPFGHPKLEDAAAIISAVLKYGDVSTSLTGKLDYAIRSVPTSKVDMRITELIGREAIARIANHENNQLLYVDSTDVKAMQIESMKFIAKLGGRTMDIRPEVGLDWAVYKQGNQAMGMADGGTLAAPQQNFTDVVELYKSMRRATWFEKMFQPEHIFLTAEQMRSVIWKLSTFEQTEDWMWIRRIVRKISDEQVAELQSMAQEAGLSETLALALKDINGFVLAANALIYRAGAMNMFMENKEAGVNIVGMKGARGGKELAARDLVNHNSYLNKVFNRYQIKGERTFEDKPANVGGLITPQVLIPPDRNLYRPLISIPYFEASVSKEEEAKGKRAYTTDEIIDAYAREGISIDVMFDYGPGGEEIGKKQPDRLLPFAKRNIPMVLASPVYKEGVRKMLKDLGKSESALVEALYSFNRSAITSKVEAVDTLTCTSNAMLSIIMALATNEAIDVADFFGRTWHSATSSNSIFSEASGRARQLIDWLRGVSVLDNFLPSGTGAERNLKVVIDSLLAGQYEEREMGERVSDLGDKAMIDAMRTGTFAGSSYELIFYLNKAVTQEQINAMLRSFAREKSDDVVKFYEGVPGESNTPLDLGKIVGMPEVSIVDGLQIKVSKSGRMLVITGWYDNQAAAPGQMLTRWGARMVDARRAEQAKALRAGNTFGGTTPESALVDGGEALSEKLVVHHSEVGKDDVAIAGGKGANLGELLKIPEIAPMVPRFVSVTTLAYKKHINEATTVYEGKTMPLKDYIEQRLAKLEAIEGKYENSEELAKAGEDIRLTIEKAKMPEEVRKAIADGYQSLCDELGVVDLPVAVRSSATAEDMADAAFAGQQDTYLNMIGEMQVIDAVQRNWASLFTDRAIYYRHNQNIPADQAFLSAVIQEMIPSVTAGTMFTVDMASGAEVYNIDATYGPGEAVVAGVANPDRWIVSKKNLRIMRRDFGDKLGKFVLKNEKNVTAKEGIEKVDTSYEERHKFCLTDEQVKKVAQAGGYIQNHYGRYMDIEWAFDPNGDLRILQARSETVWNQWKAANPNTVKIENTVVPEDVARKATVLLSGVPGAGAASGTVMLVDSEKEGPALGKELAKIQEGKEQIMVTVMTKPDMVPAMKRTPAMVTNQGGATCHAAIVARELTKPAIVGTKEATTKLKDGQEITVDANNGKVYDGRQQIVKLVDNVEIDNLPVTKTKVGVIVASPSLAMSVTDLQKFASHYGVSLMRKEVTDQVEIVMHTLVGMDYDRYFDPNFKDEAKRKWIKENIIDNEELVTVIETLILGYPSFREFYLDKMSNAIATVAAAQADNQIVMFRITDLKTNEYHDTPGGPLYEPSEKNPMMGYRGVYRMLSREYEEAYALELEAIKRARQTQKNICIMFPVVRTPDELKEMVDFCARHGLVQGEDGLELAMMVEVPANIFQADDFYKYVKRMSIGSNDLTQFTRGKGRDKEEVQGYFKEGSPAVLKALEIVIKTAKKMGVKTGFCGQKVSNDPAFAGNLVEYGIDSVGVVPEAYKKTVNAVAEAEKSGKPFDPQIEGYSIPATNGKPQHIAAGTVKAADMIKAVGIHPLVLMKYARGEELDAALKAEIAAKLNGKGAKEFVVDAVKAALKDQVEKTPASAAVIYGLDDLDKTDYEKFIGGADLEGFDENPQLGFTGTSRVVSPAYAEFSLWQAEAVASVRKETGRTNIWIQLNIALIEDVAPALEIMKQAGLVPGVDGFKVGLEIDTADNVLTLRDFIEAGIGFIAENPDRFLSYVLAIDPNSPYIQISRDRLDRALENPRKIWTSIAEQSGIPLVKDASLVTDGGSAVASLVRGLDVSVFKGLSAGYSDVMRAADEVQGANAGLIIGANTVLQNAGVVAALKDMKGSTKNLKVAVWASDANDVKKLKALGIGEVADVVTARGLEKAITDVQGLNVELSRMMVVNAPEDLKTVRAEMSKLLEEYKGIRAINLKTPVKEVKGVRMNIVPLVIGKAVAMVLKDQDTVVDAYMELARQYGGQISESDMQAVTDLTKDLSDMPLVLITGKVAEDQLTYQATADQI
ncbi:MAG TPA: phosphoenolpyruvate synthase [Candidatus Omnitrophota bacterium]|nr:phosphoenolpyruvate synthase [Candidatus Omnitrophota bacterium]